MPKSESQKLKLLYIADYLMRETDADDKGNMLHGVLLKDVKDYLKEKGIEAEEHSIRRDIDLLRGGKDAEYCEGAAPGADRMPSLTLYWIFKAAKASPSI